MLDMVEDKSEEDLIDRPRGVLNEKDRKFLVGELDFSEYKNPGQARYQRRYRIRERVEHSIIDFLILAETLPEEDIEKVFEEAFEYSKSLRETPESAEIPPILLGVRSIIGFIVYSLFPEDPELTTTTIEVAIENALRMVGLEVAHMRSSPNVTIEIEWNPGMTLAEAEENLRSGEYSDDPDERFELASDLVKTGQLDAEEAIGLLNLEPD